MAEVTLKVLGMTCGGCVRNVTRVLTSLSGVSGAAVSQEQASATVQYDPDQIDLAALRQAVEDAGFDAPQ
jgi:copper chaperone